MSYARMDNTLMRKRPRWFIDDEAEHDERHDSYEESSDDETGSLADFVVSDNDDESSRCLLYTSPSPRD